MVPADTVVATRVPAGRVTWIRFSLPFTVHNDGTDAFTVEWCASMVEARRESAWGAVWSPVCDLSSTTSLTIAPGETRDLGIEVAASVYGPGAPTWNSDAVGGTYRLALGLSIPHVTVRIPRVASNPFVVIEEE